MQTLRFFAGPALVGLVLGVAVLCWHEFVPAGFGSTTSYAHAVSRAAPAVVNIYTTRVVTREPLTTDPLFDRFLERPRRERLLSSLGSGVLVDRAGYLLTSNHVVRGGDEIIVALSDGREAMARVVGTDPETDLALLQIDLAELPVIQFAAPGSVAVGDVVLAIGNPLGVGSSVSMGIVSATGRSQLGIATFENFIQTDAAINRGNSGGALVDTDGRLIGINTAILSSNGNWQGIGFATPISVARKVMQDLIEHGRVIRGWLGVTVQDITPNLAGSFGLPEHIRGGGLISEVVPNSPAAAAGLRRGDILVGIEGTPMVSGYAAMNRIAGIRPGEPVELNLIRDRRELNVSVQVGVRPPMP